MTSTKLAAALGAVALISMSQSAMAADAKCELDRPVVFAGLDWDSNAVHTAIAQFIVEHGYGCRTDVIPGSTIPLLNGMIRGDIDVTMEMWRDNVRDVYDPAVKDGRVFDPGTNFPDATQEWYVPKYAVEGDGAPAPGLKSVSDLAKYKKVFAAPGSLYGGDDSDRRRWRRRLCRRQGHGGDRGRRSSGLPLQAPCVAK